ncbi:dihydrofolate reductase family protein [Gordonia sp. zg691]|uniref:dihydrofolate reductase family protein n=1 Tax=Gordonia jinghuaiqii TaxID=2758710 RepID=UPI0016628339|nr:dihydrofolate reductase family protein [Gordonia jinghuaiqii]MBD0861419.1 dihydrofolate reductase family protein [Gordonia jinghuaiqii]
MFHLQKATHVTSGDVDDSGDAALLWLAEQYLYPPRPAAGPGAAAPFVRANMVASIDGSVAHEGKSGGLGGPGDRLLFRVLRGLADVILVGAGTATAEGYGQPRPDGLFADLRASNGQADAPTLALVSRCLSVLPDFAPVSDPNTVVLTCAAAPADRRAALLDAGATLVDCGEDTVDPSTLLERCGERGWARVLCEGGPTLLGSLVAADLLDELCLTTSPNLVGGAAGRIVSGVGDPLTTVAAGMLHPMQPTSIITDDDGFVFTRWLRRGRSSIH